ncbi:MAG: RidA family protein [Marinilabiliaceae bacterium]|jgi:enamine deaminase RidA (YjgF/YER057c/UK114 family)|nr:RidA family protein [Marinilabiliaceae bacterium]
MLRTEKGLLGKKSSYFITFENYGDFSLLNINIIISDKPVDTGIIAAIEDLLCSKKAKVLLALAFAGHNSPYLDLVSGLGKSEIVNIQLPLMLYAKSDTLKIQFICTDSKNVSSKGDSSEIKIPGTDSIRFVYLNALIDRSRDSGSSDQAAGVFNTLKSGLKDNNLEPAGIVRTWIYLDNILGWYDEFNSVRSAYFKEHGIFDSLVPASTGIGSANAFKRAIVLSGLAIERSEGLSIETISSPLQCEALDYKSSFSRAIRLKSKEYKKLMISGTAAILPGGETAHIGEMKKQVEMTFRVLKAILNKEGMDFQDVSRAIAYFPDSTTKNVLIDCCRQNKLNADTVLMVEADICREDLLFEMEMDAFSGKQGS